MPTTLFNVNKDSVELTIDMINLKNNTTLTAGSVVFGTPQALPPGHPKNRNTQLVVSGAGDTYTDSKVIFYNRLNLGSLLNTYVPTLIYSAATTTHAILDELNAILGLILGPDDVELADITGPGDVTLVMKTNSLAWRGTAVVRLAIGATPLSVLIPDNVLNGFDEPLRDVIIEDCTDLGPMVLNTTRVILPSLMNTTQSEKFFWLLNQQLTKIFKPGDFTILDIAAMAPLDAESPNTKFTMVGRPSRGYTGAFEMRVKREDMSLAGTRGNIASGGFPTSVYQLLPAISLELGYTVHQEDVLDAVISGAGIVNIQMGNYNLLQKGNLIFNITA